jgi:hypothetical protein
MKTLLATVSVIALAGCSSPWSEAVPHTETQQSVREQGYRGIEKATVLAKGME